MHSLNDTGDCYWHSKQQMNFHSMITVLYKIVYVRSEQVLLLFITIHNYSSGKIVYLWSGKVVITLTAGWCALKFLFHTFFSRTLPWKYPLVHKRNRTAYPLGYTILLNSEATGMVSHWHCQLHDSATQMPPPELGFPSRRTR